MADLKALPRECRKEDEDDDDDNDRKLQLFRSVARAIESSNRTIEVAQNVERAPTHSKEKRRKGRRESRREANRDDDDDDDKGVGGRTLRDSKEISCEEHFNSGMASGEVVDEATDGVTDLVMKLTWFGKDAANDFCWNNK